MKAPIRAIVDTNVVLDWLVFADPAARQLGEAIRDQRVHWCVSPALLAELDAVLARPLPAKWQPARKLALTTEWRQLITPCADPQPNPLNLRCTDLTDQMFVDLALEQQAGLLLTRDRALLALRRRASNAGLSILEPRHWQGG